MPAPDASEVQIAVQSTGLCGSDLHYFNHYRNGDIIVKEPLTLGHESSGTVVSVGSAVTNLAPGDRVALEVGVSCDACEYCADGRYNICRGMRFRSSAKSFPHFQGTLQERVNHPAKWCHKLPADMSLDLGALIEPLSVAMHAQDRARLPENATILVFGAGAVGLLAAAVSRAAGAKAIVIADIQQDRLDFAVTNGFADASVLVPMARPQTIEDKLKYAQEVAAMVKETKVKGEPVGEVSAVYECTGVETCTQASIYVSSLVPMLHDLNVLLTVIDFIGHEAWWQGPHRWNGHSHPYIAHVGRRSARGRSGRRLPLRQHVRPRHRYSVQAASGYARPQNAGDASLQGHGQHCWRVWHGWPPQGR